uniref:Adhesion G protein-coupled receptor E5 n=2 Tax=Rhinolophus ferrumequinum TaxID=59479 RepID=A0A671EKV8_RHIFE
MALPQPLLPLLAAQTMGGSRCRVFLVLHALCALLILLEIESGNTTASASTDCARWCPLNSKCVNATACRCSPGFNSSSGEIFTSSSETCDDIIECGPPPVVSCGKFADCKNTEGSYYCTCNPGYEPVSGAKMFRNESENTCQDIDECQLYPRICKGRSICVNTAGSYTCECPPGFEFDQQHPNLCKDVNECTSETKPCHKTTHCLNSVGSYKCRCRPGWKPMPGSPNGPNTTICEAVISFPTWTPPHGIKSQSLSHFFEKVKNLSSNSDSPQVTIRDLIKSLEELLEEPGDLETLDSWARLRIATNLLSGLENFLRTLALTMPEAPFTYHSPKNTELSLMIQKQGNGNVTMGQSHARMLLNWSMAAGSKDSGPSVAGMLSSPSMGQLLKNAAFNLDSEKKAELEKTHESPVRAVQHSLVSAVNSVFLSNTKTEKLDAPVTFAFSHSVMRKLETRQELICAFWKGDNKSGGYWDTTGCWKLGGWNGSITCQCSHLSSFAILMAHYDIEDLKLALITKVGLSLSLVCLLLCILTFLLVRPIQGSRTTVHLHLCICLFVGSAIFLLGIENEGDKVGPGCRLVAGLLHYWFLAAFCWMSLEGLELYFLVVRVFQGQGLGKRWLYLIGYGVPGLIVAVSAAVKSEGYGRVKGSVSYCWLDYEGGLIWSFNGPVAFIILCNAVIFVTTVWKLTQKFSEINPDMKKLKKARVLTITALAQLFLLGCTWVFGLFLLDLRSQVQSYTFTILNCLQGFFLFLLHCLLNKKVREEYRKWACMVIGNKYSEFATSTSGSSNNQTRVLRPSESGM